MFSSSFTLLYNLWKRLYEGGGKCNAFKPARLRFCTNTVQIETVISENLSKSSWEEIVRSDDYMLIKSTRVITVH